MIDDSTLRTIFIRERIDHYQLWMGKDRRGGIVRWLSLSSSSYPDHFVPLGLLFRDLLLGLLIGLVLPGVVGLFIRVALGRRRCLERRGRLPLVVVATGRRRGLGGRHLKRKIEEVGVRGY